MRTLQHQSVLSPTRLLALSSAVLITALLAACGKQQAAPKEDIRPVRTITLTAAPLVGVSEFSGEVRARVESRVGFRVAGKILERRVDVGAVVKQGQVLARLDPSDLALGNAAAQAQVVAARVNRDQVVADEKRFAELRDKGFISNAEYDRRKAAADAARAQFDQASASARVQTNQANYTTLVAPFDGIVTGFEAEAGQVVTAGQTVLRMADPKQKEIQINVPEQTVGMLRVGVPAQVRLWANGATLSAKVREIAPAADTSTRTFAVRVALDDPAQVVGVALGMTATTRFEAPNEQQVLRVPLSALLREADATYVWVLDAAASTVRKVPVKVATVAQNDVIVSSGITPGLTVVTAGAHLLKDGQKVVQLKEDVAATAAASGATPAAQAPANMSKPAAAQNAQSTQAAPAATQSTN